MPSIGTYRSLGKTLKRSPEEVRAILEEFGEVQRVTVDIVLVMAKFPHGEGKTKDIYPAMRERRLENGRSWTVEPEANIRCHLQRHCKLSAIHKKVDTWAKWADIFRNPKKGTWSLRSEVLQRLRGD